MRSLLPLLCATCLLLPASAAEQPNVLLIISDDQAWGDFGFMGHPHIQTPHLDKLAAENAAAGNMTRTPDPGTGQPTDDAPAAPGLTGGRVSCQG